jgi:hypothetical protein
MQLYSKIKSFFFVKALAKIVIAKITTTLATTKPALPS